MDFFLNKEIRPFIFKDPLNFKPSNLKAANALFVTIPSISTSGTLSVKIYWLPKRHTALW